MALWGLQASLLGASGPSERSCLHRAHLLPSDVASPSNLALPCSCITSWSEFRKWSSSSTSPGQKIRFLLPFPIAPWRQTLYYYWFSVLSPFSRLRNLPIHTFWKEFISFFFLSLSFFLPFFLPFFSFHFLHFMFVFTYSLYILLTDSFPLTAPTILPSPPPLPLPFSSERVGFPLHHILCLALQVSAMLDASSLTEATQETQSQGMEQRVRKWPTKCFFFFKWSFLENWQPEENYYLSPPKFRIPVS